jgi:tRNA (cmo5U34)-methyltransferase
MKSTVEQIRAKFNNDVERFSNLETGQSAAIDAPLMLEVISQAADTTIPGATDLLDSVAVRAITASTSSKASPTSISL